MANCLDIFRSDFFSFTNLTQSILKLPYKPARIGEMGLFQDKGIPTLTAVVEEKNGLLSLLTTAARGAQGSAANRSMRKARPFVVPHIPYDDAIMADDVQGVRAFGSENEVLTVAGLVNERLTEMRNSHEVTLEWHRLGALHGKLLDADASTVLYDLFQEFGIGDANGATTNDAKITKPSGYTNGYSMGTGGTSATNDMNTAGYAPEFGVGQGYLDIGKGADDSTTGGTASGNTNRYAWKTTYGTGGLAPGQHGYVFPFSDPTTNIRAICIAIARDIKKTLGMAQYESIHAFCGSNFFDKLVDHDDVRQTFLNWTAAATLRGDLRRGFEYGGITWENYEGSVGGTLFQNSNEAIIFPMGVPGLFQTYYAPANFVETVNTIGLPLYAKQEPLPFNTGIKIHTQSNPLAMCCRPLVLIKGAVA